MRSVWDFVSVIILSHYKTGLKYFSLRSLTQERTQARLALSLAIRLALSLARLALSQAIRLASSLQHHR